MVTRAAALPRAETVRLLERLGAAGVSAPLVVVNAVGPGTCRRCRVDACGAGDGDRRASRRRRRAATRRRRSSARAEMPPPHGWRRLGGGSRPWRRRDAVARSQAGPRRGRLRSRRSTHAVRYHRDTVAVLEASCPRPIVYCVVAARGSRATAACLPGLPGAERPQPFELDDGALAGDASVPLDRYGPEPLEASLRDLDWVGRDRAGARSGRRTLRARARRDRSIPMKLFTMFSTAGPRDRPTCARGAASSRACSSGSPGARSGASA